MLFLQTSEAKEALFALISEAKLIFSIRKIAIFNNSLAISPLNLLVPDFSIGRKKNLFSFQSIIRLSEQTTLPFNNEISLHTIP